MNSQVKILFLDHRDSFSENLIAALRARGCVVDCVLSDPTFHAESEQHLQKLPFSDTDVSWRQRLGDYDGLVLSPGPGRPEQYATSHDLIKQWPAEKPLLGVCLGHQMLLVNSGSELALVDENPVHGRRENVVPCAPSRWLNQVDFQGVAVFYNSWAVDEEHLKKAASEWLVTALGGPWIAACEHKKRPWIGVQFHPESFASEQGSRILDAFVALLGAR